MRTPSLILPLLLLCTTSLPGCYRTVHPPVSIQAAPAAHAFPHELFAKALTGRVTEEGLIDFQGLAQNRGDFDRYLGTIAKVSPMSHPELFPSHNDVAAYYINAYNALALQGVLDRSGLKSVDDVKVGYFYLTRYIIGGQKLDLSTLEHKVIRPTLNDPRVHFALNCMSVGCPTFPMSVFPVDGLDAFLDEQTRRFVHHPNKVRLGDDGVWEISKIFEWYSKDFEDAGGPAAYIHRYREEVPTDARVRFLPYDWSLIAQEGRGP